MSRLNRNFTGDWRIIELPDMMDEYVDEGQGKPSIRLTARYEDIVNGEYEIGLSSGSIDGAVRSFGGETIVIFGFEGMDEMDPASGGGWLRLRADGKLEGEFVNGLGQFVAKRVALRRKPGKRRQ